MTDPGWATQNVAEPGLDGTGWRPLALKLPHALTPMDITRREATV
jgi:hypothetical protein